MFRSSSHRVLQACYGLLLLLLGACSTSNTGGRPLPDFIRSGVAGQALREPARAHDLNPDPRVIEIELAATVSEYEFIAGQPSEVWSYNGQLPGPLIEAQVGDELHVHFRNELPMPTTVHWHGIRLPQPMDGSHASQEPVPPGGSFEYRFSFPDAGMYWYHPHFAGDEQFSRGLYGAIIVRDPDDPLRDFPSRVLVLSDIELDGAGQVQPASTRARNEIEHSLGTTGNTLLVNGQILPILTLQPGSRERWYIVNAAAARIYKIGLAGQTFQLVGTDGGLIENPVSMTELVLGNGERAELVIDAPLEPGASSLNSLVYPHLRFVDGYVPDPAATLLKIEYDGVPVKDQPLQLPQNLTVIPQPEEAVITRGFQLNAIVPPDPQLSAGDFTSHGVSHSDMETSRIQFRINGQTYPNVPTFEPKLGSTEIWRINNHTGMDHPFHIHGFRFQILSIDDEPYPNRAWKDTVNLPTTETGGQWYELAVVFDGHPGVWPYHCHILYHQEHGMMGDFTVVP